jgi:hypothetical protein
MPTTCRDANAPRILSLLGPICSRQIILLLLMLTSLQPGYLALAQEIGNKPTIKIAPIVLIEPLVETAFPIQVEPNSAALRNAFLRIKGLPPQAKFSDGYFVSPGTWALPLGDLDQVRLTVPLATAGRTDLQLVLLAIDGQVLAEAKVTLAVTAGALSAQNTTPGSGPSSEAKSALRPQQSASVAAIPPPMPEPPQPTLVAREPRAAPLIKPEDRDRAVKLLARGNAEMALGDIAAARLLYQRAAEVGLADAAMAMASTFDARELERRGVKGLRPDLEAARKWYERARSLGATDAEDRLRRIGAP